VEAQPLRHARARPGTANGWYGWVARTGLAAKGVSYGLVGVLAIALAAGHGGAATSRQGALRDLAQHSFGKVMLVLLALGFAAYALWRVLQAIAARGDAKKWGKRAGYLGRAAIYTGLTYSTVKILSASGGQQSQTAKAHHTTAVVLSWPGGRWIVGAAGLCVVGAGAWNAYRGLAQKFAEKWHTSRMSRGERKWACRIAVAGHLARGAVFGLIGVFLIKAALDYDPKKAIGLDGALQKLAHAAYGPYLLGITAAGLVCYALYCFVDVRYRDVSPSA
jgi:uncharacterized protein DUF1206